MNLIIEIFSYKPFYPGFWWKFGFVLYWHSAYNACPYAIEVYKEFL
jgi:hypothetical protein